MIGGGARHDLRESPACRNSPGRGPTRKSSASRSWCRRKHSGRLIRASAQRRRAIHFGAVERAPRKRRSAARPHRAPLADRVEIFERESERVQNFVAARARRILAMRFHALANGRVAIVVLFSLSAGTLAGGGRAACPEYCRDPFAALHGRCARGDRRSRSGCFPAPASRGACCPRVSDAPELAAVDIWNSVMLAPAAH